MLEPGETPFFQRACLMTIPMREGVTLNRNKVLEKGNNASTWIHTLWNISGGRQRMIRTLVYKMVE